MKAFVENCTKGILGKCSEAGFSQRPPRQTIQGSFKQFCIPHSGGVAHFGFSETKLGIYPWRRGHFLIPAFGQIFHNIICLLTHHFAELYKTAPRKRWGFVFVYRKPTMMIKTQYLANVSPLCLHKQEMSCFKVPSSMNPTWNTLLRGTII